MSLPRVRVSGTTAFQIGSRSSPVAGVREIGEVSTGPGAGIGRSVGSAVGMVFPFSVGRDQGGRVDGH
ncbi:hypothetical protein SHIRM173S_12436 [Streptomyces hirsutus]